MPKPELLGREPSPVHRKLFARLRSWIKSECRPLSFSVAKAGRRFPQLIARLSELSLMMTKSGLSGDPYSRDFQGVAVDKDDYAVEELRPYRSLDPSRLVLHGTGHWDITSYLPDELCMVYREPEVIKLRRTPLLHEYPRISDSRETVAELARLWDKNRLLVVHDDCGIETRSHEKVKVFNAMKSRSLDRQIGDRRGRNSVESKVEGDSIFLPAGSDLLDLQFSPSCQNLWLYASDRKDFYHQIWATVRRSKTNTLGPALRKEDLLGTQGFEDFLRRSKKKYLRTEHGDRLGEEAADVNLSKSSYYASFGAVLQGDHAGVDMATSAHVAALQEVGCLGATSRLVANVPPRHAEVLDGLVIDDYFVVGIEEKSTPAHLSRAALFHSRAQGAYERHKLLGSPQKDLIGEREGKLIGAHVDASERTTSLGLATVGSPPEKRYGLSWLALQVAQLRCTSDALHLSLVGGFVSMLMFRRPFMSILAKSFAVVNENDFNPDCPRAIPLPRAVCDELVLLAVLAPLAISNIAADFHSKVFCTDASMERGAVLEAPVSETIAKVIHRSLKSKGAYTRLQQDPEEVWKEDGPVEAGGPSPDRPLAFYYDFIEIFSGAARVTHFMASRGWTCGPPLDLTWSEEVNLTFVHVASWIAFMICGGRLRAFMVEPPCTTFSVMRRPALRSKLCPFGFRPRESKTLLGNQLAMRAFQFLFLAARYLVPGILENPNASLIKNLPSWKTIQNLAVADMCRSDSCQFGSPHQKPFKFLGVHVKLEPLRRRCNCKGSHIKVEGKYTKQSATYTDELADTLSQVLSSAILATRPKKEKELPGGHENLAVNEVMKSSSWSVRASWAFKHQKHINVLELEALLRLVSSLAFEKASKRIVAMVDSLVTKGAVCKGRSSSLAISNVLRKICSTIVAADLYVTVPYVPTRLNCADDPTRMHEVRGPVRVFGIEEWTEEDLFELALRGGLRRSYANWASLVVGLLGPSCLRLSDRASYRSFPIQPTLQLDHSCLDFDPSLGFPGEGPIWTFFIFFLGEPLCPVSLSGLCRPDVRVSARLSVAMAMPVFPRNPADAARQRVRQSRPDLVPGRRVTEVTTSMRQVLMTTFKGWLLEEGIDWQFLLENSHSHLEEINGVLSWYGRILYQNGRPLQHFSETIDAVVAEKPHLKRSLQGAWNLAFGWNQAEPSVHHLAMPFQVLLAMLSVSVCWRWYQFAGVLALAWGCFLRLGEFLTACRHQLLLPSDVGHTVHFAMFTITEPKTRNVGAKVQTTKLDIPDLLAFVEICLGSLHRGQRLWPMSGQTFRQRFRSVLRAIGLDKPFPSASKVLDPGSLRAGGATWALMMTEDAPLVQRRGRWLTARTMEIYIQEVAATQFLSHVPEEIKEKILSLAFAFPGILQRISSLAAAKVPQQFWRLHP